MTTQPIADLRSEAHRYSFHLGTEELIKRLPAPQSDQCDLVKCDVKIKVTEWWP